MVGWNGVVRLFILLTLQGLLPDEILFLGLYFCLTAESSVLVLKRDLVLLSVLGVIWEIHFSLFGLQAWENRTNAFSSENYFSNKVSNFFRESFFNDMLFRQVSIPQVEIQTTA